MSNQNLEKIDASLKSMKDFAAHSHGTASTIQKMRQEIIFSDGIYPAKTKVLIATMWAISAKCEPCLKFYIMKAKELGVTEEELGEVLAIGSTMGGCVGEMWCLKAYHAFKDNTLELGNDTCCEIDA